MSVLRGQRGNPPAAPPSPDSGEDFRGTERFEVIRRLGAGGMGVVYEAHDHERDVRVALKTLRTLKPDAILRFKNEFRALQDIQHPNLVTLGELFEERQRWFFTMEMVHGSHFLDYVRRADEGPPPQPGRLPAEQVVTAKCKRGDDAQSDEEPTQYVLSLEEERAAGAGQRLTPERLASGVDEQRLRAAMAQLALGLAALHGAQKVHRDIKPSNILVTSEGRVVVLDFGLVADLLNAYPESHLVGTFSYMAPEQAGLKPIGPATDWYSVGVLLYQALTGRLPVTGNPREVLVLKQTFAPPPPHAIAEVPDDLDLLCVDLLRIDPRARPSGRDVLRRLHAEAGGFVPGTPGTHFFGRRVELDALRNAFAMSRNTRAVTFLVHGESGVGKSALTRRFTDELLNDVPSAVIFAGRCYERESVPYKAVDGVIDALSRYLTSLGDTEVSALLPRQRGLIGQVFPVMRRVEAVAQASKPEPGTLDPQVLRARLFFALRDLFTRLAERYPLVLVIDDLQWADADSLAMLAEIMEPPDAPRVLLVATLRAALRTEAIRAEQSDHDTSVRSMEQIASVFGGAVRQLHIEALPREDARALVGALLRDAGTVTGVDAAVVADEAGGHPLFIDELVRSWLSVGAQPGQLKLEDALWARIERLDPGDRRLLELVAVAGAPVVQETAAQAVRIDFGELARRAAKLRADKLVRTVGVRRTDTVEPYHDRVREAVLLHLTPSTRRQWHERLALALEASQHADPEALAMHWRGAGEPEKAMSYAVRAAAEAEEALAFDRAARLYMLAFELRPIEGAEGSALRTRLGNALANAGRGAEAARAYLAAVDSAQADAVLDLRRRVAEQFLRSGLIDEGVEQLGIVLGAVGMTVPKTPHRALASLLFQRARVRFRGIGFRERRASEIAPDVLERADICWSAGVVLGMVDNVRGADFQARGLLLALEAGEPERISRALSLEACFASTAGGAGKERVEMLLGAAVESAHKAGTAFVLAWCALADGTAAFCMGEFQRSYDSSVRAKETFTNRCTGVAWERETADFNTILSAFYLGRLKELTRRVERGRREADERGDLFASLYVRSGFALMSWLAQDDPGGARRETADTLRRWSSRGYFFAHYWCFIGAMQIDLYEGDAKAAYDRAAAEWSPLTSSLLLRSVQIVRVESLHARARAALAMATQGHADRKALLREAENDARRLDDEGMGYATSLAELARAAVSWLRGDAVAAESHLKAAAAGFDAADMRLYAAAARWRRAEILGVADVIASVEAWMREEGIQSPARMVAMLAPGFTEGAPAPRPTGE